MDVKQLRTFIALVREQHFSRAAASCHISQPALSAQIRKLEEELGIPLIKRGNSYGGLTPEGERVLVWARRVVQAADNLMDDVALLRDDLSGPLNIGVIPSALPMLPLLTGVLLKVHPGLRPQVYSMSSKEIQRGLDSLMLDVGVSYLDNEPLKGVAVLGLYHEEFSLLATETLAADLPSEVTWDEAAALPLILLTPDMQNRRIIDDAFAQLGLTPAPIIEANSVVTLYGHARAAGLCSIVPRNHAALLGLPPGLVLRRLVAPVVRHRIGLVRHMSDVVAPRIAALWQIAGSRDLPSEFDALAGTSERVNTAP